MSAWYFIGTLIVAVFAYEMIGMWWRQNAWRRHWRDRDDEER